jgi:hypothetical protein
MEEGMSLVRDLGFPAWAGALIYAVVKISSLFRGLVDQLSTTNANVEKRLALLENIVERHERMLEHHDQTLARK